MRILLEKLALSVGQSVSISSFDTSFTASTWAPQACRNWRCMWDWEIAVGRQVYFSTQFYWYFLVTDVHMAWEVSQVRNELCCSLSQLLKREWLAKLSFVVQASISPLLVTSSTSLPTAGLVPSTIEKRPCSPSLMNRRYFHVSKFFALSFTVYTAFYRGLWINIVRNCVLYLLYIWKTQAPFFNYLYIHLCKFLVCKETFDKFCLWILGYGSTTYWNHWTH